MRIPRQGRPVNRYADASCGNDAMGVQDDGTDGGARDATSRQTPTCELSSPTEVELLCCVINRMGQLSVMEGGIG